jgi:capsular polysaccharide biosynthesis protein
MTIDELFHRVVRGHWLLILTCIVVPVTAMLYLGGKQPVLYQAVGRLQFGSTLASSNVEADAASTRALGIVTSPGVVQQALAEAHLAADPTQFALDHVDVSRVGVSPVIEVSVTQENPGKAALIDKSLISQLLDFSNSAGWQTGIDQVKSLDAVVATLTKQRDALIPLLRTVTLTTPGRQLSLEAQIGGIQASLADVLQQRSNLLVAAASRPSTALLDPVRTPTVPMPRSTIPMSALAGLLGLIAGLGLAAGLETLRPRLRSSKAIVYTVGAPLIGHLRFHDLGYPLSGAAINRIADRMALFGLKYGSSRAMLLPVRVDDQPLAAQMADALGTNGDIRTSHRLQCAAMNGHWVEPGDHPVIVVFSPAKIRARQLRPVQELIDSLDWPVLGVVTYDRPHRFARRRAANLAAEASGDAAAHPHVNPVKHAVAHRRTA